MTQAAWVKQSTGGRDLMPVDGYKIMMFTDINGVPLKHLNYIQSNM